MLHFHELIKLNRSAMFKIFKHTYFSKLSSVKIKAYIIDVIALLLLFYLSIKTLVPVHDGVTTDNLMPAAIRLLWLSSPLFFTYLILRACKLPVLLCLYVLFSIIIALTFVNDTKIALTNEPLSFNDIVYGISLSVVGKYLSFVNIITAALIILGAIIIARLSKNVITTRNNYILIITLLIMAFPFASSPYAEIIFGKDSRISQTIIKQAKERNVIYFSWDPLRNVKEHGLPMHLIQTSVRKSIPEVTDTEREMYLGASKSAQSQNATPKTIIYVLCESCWYDEKHFKNNFNALLDQGYKAFRAQSPVYGGGTSNVEFEMLTGLPSNSEVLSGIIYQEYAEPIKQNADTLASALKRKGFDTFAAHNNVKTFWRRNIIYQKFGFDKFQGLSEMGDLPSKYADNKQPWQWHPDDYLLYNAALKAIKHSSDNGNSIFLNLITMSTHGPYYNNNDSGEGVYDYILREAAERLAQFTTEVMKIDPNAIIVVYGDHKPALNKFFYENGILSPDLFTQTGMKDEDFEFKPGISSKDYGDVPIFIKANNIDKVQKIIAEANHKPYFCVSAIIDKNLIESNLIAFKYNTEHYCNPEGKIDDNNKNVTPAWVYAMALFEK
jgi:phosphoglycerol transferase MdoB-like AlkP superfamily enzyme